MVLNNFEIIATTLFGLEEILSSELQKIGATDILILNRAVKYKGDTEVLYRSNYQLRTAVKILVPIATFQVNNEEQLYNQIKKINWSKYISNRETFAIDGTTSGELFTHSKFVALKSKDAIADYFRDKTGARPSVDTEDPDLRINIHITENNCTVSLDSSGTPLTKRGYKYRQTFAPLSEVLAAGLILLSGWKADCDFMDPMCGSGTIAIEAAMIAYNIPAGYHRSFGFEKWNNFDRDLFIKIKNTTKKQRIKFDKKIYAFDKDFDAIQIAATNASKAGVDEYIDITARNFFKSEEKYDNVFIIMNPPYGERLEDKDEMVDFYKNIGSKLKHFYTNCQAWILSGNLDAIKFIGLKPSKKIKVFNGPLDCRFHKFDLYAGSKKASKNL